MPRIALTVALSMAAATSTHAATSTQGDVPSPEPTALREIGHVRSSAFCQALHRLVLPLALVAEHNERAFVALEEPVASFRAGKGLAATGNALHVALTQGAAGLQTVVQSDSVANADPLASDEEDDENTYTPKRTLAAANIDRIIGEVRRNLVKADKIMDASWKAYPGRANPDIDALRLRMQNIVDLQRALANHLDDVAGLYLSNVGMARSQSKNQRANYKAVLDQMIDAQIAQADAAVTSLRADASPAPAGDVRSAKRGTAAEVTVALRGQERALAYEGPRALQACSAAP